MLFYCWRLRDKIFKLGQRNFSETQETGREWRWPRIIKKFPSHVKIQYFVWTCWVISTPHKPTASSKSEKSDEFPPNNNLCNFVSLLDIPSSSRALCYQYLSIFNQIPHFIDLLDGQILFSQRRCVAWCAHLKSGILFPPPPHLILSRSIAVPRIIHLVHHHHQFLVLFLLHLQPGPDKVFESDFSFCRPWKYQITDSIVCTRGHGHIFRRTLSAFWWAGRARFMTYSGSNTTLDWIDSVWPSVGLSGETPSPSNGERCKLYVKWTDGVVSFAPGIDRGE